MDDNTRIREINALISLVDEPDQLVFDDIAKKIHSFGQEVVPFLEQAWENNFNPLVQKRIENLIHSIQFEVIAEEFSHWVQTGYSDLMEAWFILTRYQYPLFNESEMHYEINQIRKDIWLEMNENLTALEQIKVFNHVFYDVHGFKGDVDNYHSPDNSFLNKVLQTRRGNPLSLSIIYMTLAQSLDLPVFGVNLPEHFVLAYTGNTFDPETFLMDKQVVLFYINAFSKGAIFSKKDIEDFISQLGIETKDSFFLPCNNHDIVHRMLNNLIVSYQKSEMPEKVNEIIRLRDMLTENE